MTESGTEPKRLIPLGFFRIRGNSGGTRRSRERVLLTRGGLILRRAEGPTNRGASWPEAEPQAQRAKIRGLTLALYHVGHTPFDGFAVRRLGNSFQLHYARPLCNAQMLCHPAVGGWDEVNALRCTTEGQTIPLS
jgi:hypothetical protein